MKNKTTKTAYWIITGIFSLFFLIDRTSAILGIEEGQSIMEHLGYPVYLLGILGWFKALGSLVILEDKFPTVKEWAYTGFTFHFIGAFSSRVYVGDSVALIISPLVAFMFVSYFLQKKITLRSKNHSGKILDDGF